MINFSKLRELSIPYNCYEVGHTWTPECSEAALTVGYFIFLEGMKIYAPLYLISQAMQKKYSWKAFLSTIQSTFTSTCFLSFNGFAFIFIFCLLRKIMGKFYYLHCSYLPAVAASFLAILIERKNRRGPLALYVTNVASETIFRMCVSRGLIKPLKNGEVYLFSTTMALFFYIVRINGYAKDFVSFGLSYLVGKEESKLGSKIVSTSATIQKLETHHEGDITKNNKTNFFQRLSYFWHICKTLKLKCCPHSTGCVHYVILGYLKPFLAGYITYASIQLLFKSNIAFKSPKLLLSLLLNKRVFNLGLFLGGFAGTFKLINCLLRWVFKTDKAVYAIPAAFLGGLFMKFFPSSTLALYLMWKLIEMAYNLGIQYGILPEIKGSMLIMYSCFSAVLFYAAVLEPHNLKPAYLKFLSRITHNRIGAINRHVLDIFGTHASRLYTHFWPELDLKYCSRVFQESVLLWLIN